MTVSQATYDRGRLEIHVSCCPKGHRGWFENGVGVLPGGYRDTALPGPGERGRLELKTTWKVLLSCYLESPAFMLRGVGNDMDD